MSKSRNYRRKRQASRTLSNLNAYLRDTYGLPDQNHEFVDGGQTSAPQHNNLLTPQQVAAICGLSEKTLANWRSSGSTGLAFVRVGSRIFYRRSDIDAFIQAGVVTSTAQYMKGTRA